MLPGKSSFILDLVNRCLIIVALVKGISHKFSITRIKNSFTTFFSAEPLIFNHN